MTKRYAPRSGRSLVAGAFLLLIACGVCLSQGRAGEEAADAPAIATGTMQKWLEEIDQGKYAQSWTEAAPVFQAAITQEGWTAALNRVRTPLGQCTERKLASASRQAAPPSPQAAVKGDMILAQFETSFAGLKYAVETVTFMKAPDGTWKAAGYYIKPRI